MDLVTNKLRFPLFNCFGRSTRRDMGMMKASYG